MKQLTSIPLYGLHSEDLALIQTELTKQGFNTGTADGIYGKNTRRAVATFQKANGLADDGIIGPKTLKALGFEVKTPVRPDGFAALSWEKNHPERAEWTNIVYGKIEALWQKLQKCTDMTDLRPDYNTLSQKQQKSIWAELICSICLYESGWKPTSWMTETTMDKDPVTGKQVKSEGLMQLSYQDERSYPSLPCSFDWEADKFLDQNDLHKTIFSPRYNLEFGIEILSYQIDKFEKIAMDKNVYWAVLRKGGKYSKLSEISKMVRSVSF